VGGKSAGGFSKGSLARCERVQGIGENIIINNEKIVINTNN